MGFMLDSFEESSISEIVRLQVEAAKLSEEKPGGMEVACFGAAVDEAGEGREGRLEVVKAHEGVEVEGESGMTKLS